MCIVSKKKRDNLKKPDRRTKKQDNGKGKPRGCSVINVEKCESINKFAEESKSAGEDAGRGRKFEGADYLLEKTEGDGLREQPKGWSLSVKKRDSPSMELSRLWAGSGNRWGQTAGRLKPVEHCASL